MFESLYSQLSENNINLNEKERFIISSLPTVHLVKNALLIYKCKSGSGYLTAILGFFMEASEFPIDYFNEYSLTLGRQSQGVSAFKNAMTCMVDKSKKVPTKPDITEAH